MFDSFARDRPHADRVVRWTSTHCTGKYKMIIFDPTEFVQSGAGRAVGSRASRLYGRMTSLLRTGLRRNRNGHRTAADGGRSSLRRSFPVPGPRTNRSSGGRTGKDPGEQTPARS
jgi:hypothetical protein